MDSPPAPGTMSLNGFATPTPVDGPVTAAHLTEQNRDLSVLCLYSVPHDAHRSRAFFPMSRDDAKGKDPDCR